MISPNLLPPELTSLLTRIFVDTRTEARRALRSESTEEREHHLREIFKIMDILHNFPVQFSRNPEAALSELYKDFLDFEETPSALPAANPNRVRGRYSSALYELLNQKCIVVVRD